MSLIMVDIDGVLANFDEAFRKSMYEVLGIDKRNEFATTWSLIDSYDITKEEHDEIWESRQLQLNMAAASVFPLAKRILDTLPKESFYVTARGSNLSHPFSIEFRKLTLEWLLVNGFADNPIIFSNDKVNVCRRLNIRIAIDDAPHHVEDLLSDGIEVYMPVHEYNKHLLGRPGLIALHGWSELKS